MLSKIIYYAISIILVTTLIFVPLIFSYQHIIEKHILDFNVSFKFFQYLVSSIFILILLAYMNSLK